MRWETLESYINYRLRKSNETHNYVAWLNFNLRLFMLKSKEVIDERKLMSKL